MYEEWLKACSEKELFVFYEHLYITFVFDDTVDERSLEETKKLLYKAREYASRYFSDNCPNFERWYGFWKFWAVDLGFRTEWTDLLRRMPWNLEKEDA